MAAKDLMFKIAIFDDTKKELDGIKKNLAELEKYALGLSEGVTAAVKSIRELGNGFKVDVPNLSAFAEQIGKIDKALGKKDAFKVKDLEDAMNTIKKLGEQLSGGVIRKNDIAETFNALATQLENGAKKMNTATTSSLETYRDQLKIASKEIDGSIAAIRERIREAFDGNGNLYPKGSSDLRKLFGLKDTAFTKEIAEYAKKFDEALTRVQDRLKSYDKSIVNNQYLVGDIGKIKEELNQLETTVIAVRNGLSGKGLLGNMPDHTEKQIAELGNIIGKLTPLEQRLQTFGNGEFPNVMKGFVDAVSKSVTAVEARINGTAVAAMQGHAGAQQLSVSFSEGDILTPLQSVQQRIKDIIEQIKKDVSDGLKDALGSDISATKTVQSLNELANGLSGLETKLQGVNQFSKTLRETMQQAGDVLSNLKGASTGGNTVTDNNGKGAIDLKALLRNQETIDALRVKVFKAMEAADKYKDSIATNGGSTEKVDAYIKRLSDLRDMLLEVRNNAALLGQSGTIMIPRDGLINQLSTRLQEITGQKGNGTLGELMGMVKELTTPAGKVGRTIQAEADSFKQAAKEYEDAAARIKKAKDSLSDLRGKVTDVERVSMENGKEIVGIDRLRTLLNEINELQRKLGNTTDAREGVKLLGKEYDTLAQRVRDAVNAQNEALRNRERVNQRLDPIGQYLETANATYSRGSSLGVDATALSNLDSAIRKMTALQNEIIGFGKADYLDKNKMQGVLDQYVQLRNTILNAASAVSVLANKQQSLNDRQQRVDYKAAKQAAQEQADSWAKATENLARYDNKLKDAEALLRNVEDVNQRLGKNIDTTGLRDYVDYLRAISRQLHEINNNNVVGTAAFGRTNPSVPGVNGKLYSGVVGAFEKNQAVAGERAQKDASQALAQALKEEAEAQKKAEQAKRQSAQASEQLAKSENTVAQAIANSTNAARGQSQVLSDLKSMAAQYLSVWGAQQFISDMTNITGELELQRKSLEVILGSGTAATEMYSQLRDLSQQSPYTFEDLLKSHRQLAAFGIEAKNIYDTMKALTDIGAGLDVDVSRLILAYGHTRSYGYLSGIQNRQFETAGIDLVGALTKHYNDLADAEEKAGRAAEHVTRKDIFKRMRTRDIAFEDVEKVIMDMDKPGGKFYNMQIRQYDTLGGKLRNLRNNYRIMMSEMGQSGHGILTFSVNAINTITENWAKFAQVLEDILIPLGSIKLAMFALNAAGAKVPNSIAASTLEKLRKQAATAQVAPVSFWGGLRQGWGSRVSRMDVGRADAKAFATELDKAFKDGSITKNMAAQLAYSKELPPRLRQIAAAYSGMSKQQAVAASTTLGMSRAFNLLGRRITGAGLALGNFAKGMAATIFNPATAVMAVISAVVAGLNWLREENNRVEDASDQLRDNASRDLETLSQTLDEYQGKYGIRLGKTPNGQSIHTASTASHDGKVPNDTIEGMPTYWRNGAYNTLDITQMMADGIENIMEDLDKKLQVMDPLYKGDLFDIQKFDSQYSQANAIMEKLSDIEFAKQIEERTPDVLATANKESHNIFTDSYATDIKDLQKASQKAEYALMKLSSKDVNDYLDDRKRKDVTGEARKFIEEFEKNNADLNKAGMEREKIQRMLSEGGLKAMGNTTWNGGVHQYIDALGDLDDAKEEVESSIPEIAATMEKAYTQYFQGRPGAFTYYLRNQFDNLMTQFKVSDPSVIEDQFLALYQRIAQDLASKSDMAGMIEFQKQFANAVMGKEVESEITKNLNGRKISQLTKPELDKLIDLSVKNVKERLINKFPKELHPVIRRLFNVGSDELESAMNTIRNKTADFSEQWKKDANGKLGNTLFGPLIKSSQSFIEWIDEAGKKAKEFTDGISKLKPVMKVKFGMDFSSAKQMRDYFRTYTYYTKGGTKVNLDLSKPLNALPKKIKSKKDGSIVDTESVKQLYDFLNAMSEVEEYNKSNGTTIGHDTKKENAARNKAEQAARKADNDEEKRLSARLKLIQDAYNMYKKYYELYGKDRAIEEVRKNYKDLRPSDFASLTSLDGLIALYNDFIQEVKNAKWKRPKEMKDRADSLISQGTTGRQNAEYNRDKDAMEKWASKESLWLDRLTKQWDTYSKVRKATGDMALAIRLSGFNGEEFANQADALRSHIAREVSNLNLKGEDGSALGINFSDVLDMGDDQIGDKVKSLFGNNEKYATQIKAITDDLKKWRDLQMQVYSESAESYASAVGKMQDYDSVMRRNNAAARIENEKIDKNENLTDEEKKRAKAVNNQEALTKNLKASIGYINLINRTLAMGDADFVDNLEKAEKDLGDRLRENTISASEYAQEMRKLSDLQQKRAENAFFGKNTAMGALIQRGVPGLSQYYKDSIDERRSVLAANGMTQEQIDRDPEIRKMQKHLDKITDLINNFGDLSTVIGVVTGVFNGLQQAATDLANMFDALGNEHMANFFSDFSDVVSGISSVFTPVDNILKNAMSGNVSGVVSSAISAPVSMVTAPITAFAKLHDKKRQRSIDRLQRDVSAIEGYAETISKAQSRTLGYDYGDVIRGYQRQYADNQKSKSVTINGVPWLNLPYNTEGAAGTAMAKYYGSAGADEDLTGYQQQYNLLVAKRNDYMDMYNAENDKKKKNNDVLEEYKQKIADLDDQIKYFSEDLAKTLFDIDFKSWADQLSDALMTAFENGEDAAKAFDDSVTSILQGIVKKMVTTGVMEPLFNRLRDQLFGYTDSNGTYHKGSFDASSPESNRDVWMGQINEALGDDGYIRKGTESAKALFDVMESLAQKSGNTLLNSNSASMSSSIKSMTEQTGDLLAAYLNAIRADVSVIRQVQAIFYQTLWPDYVKQVTSGVSYLQNIDNNTRVIRDLISENGALFNQVRDLRDDMHRLVTHQEYINVR